MKLKRVLTIPVLFSLALLLVQAPETLAAPLSMAPQIVVNDSPACSEPLPEREGGWFCVDPDDVSVSARQTCGTWSGYKGCWTRDASYQDSFSGTGVYGYGGDTIGTATITFKDVITGYSFSSNQVSVKSTHSMSAVSIGTVRSRLSSGSSGASGTNISGTDRSVDLGNAPAGTTKTGNPVVGYDNTASYLSVSHKPSWGTPGVSGRWYYGAKSLIMYKSGQYLFYADERRPAQEIYVGWG